MNPYPNLPSSDVTEVTRKTLQSDQDVRWCPGCGDYSVLAQIQKVLPTLGIPKEDYVFISGIGCSSRFPYYMDTYGMHSIHGRAPAIATGVKAFRPNLSVWVMTGDGDGLSIGGNHLIHTLRRNVDLKIILFNNRIYGLTKGQYSPTSDQGKVTKTSPMGSLDYPFNPISLALGSEATFVARTVDKNPKHMQEVLAQAAAHKGTAFVEIFQNCVIFNDGVFDFINDRKTKKDNELILRHGEKLRFGADGEKGIAVDAGLNPIIVDVAEHGLANLLTHDEKNTSMAYLLSRLTYPDFPTPIGVFKSKERPTYDELLQAQINEAKARNPNGCVQDLLNGGNSWTVD